MKKQILCLFLLLAGFSTGYSQTYKKDVYSPFFEQVTYQGAFPVSGQGSNTVSLYGQTIKNYDATDWNTAGGNWTKDWTNWDPQNTVYPGDGGYTGPAFITVNVSGDITTNTIWGSNDGSPTLIKASGAIHVTNGATLTIKPNTFIRGDANNISFLLITKGSKIYAIGTPDKPIVMTSTKAPGQRTSGDWAGFLIMGKSQNNTSPNGTGVRRFEALPADPLSEYGGGGNFDIHDNSGEVRFLRVEFAGYNYLPDQEINGVTFGAVGDQTRFDFCQVSFSRDDSYEWFGGSNDHKYLVAWAGIDDEFDMDEGYQGRCQYLLGVRKNDIFETSAGGSSHGFEHDNNTGWGTSAQNVVGVNNPQPSTRPVISNATLVGPRIGNIPNITGNRFNAGMAFRTGDESCVYNSIVTGYPRQFEFFHNGATLMPSAQQKFIGVSDISGSISTSNYVKNEVMKTILITDVNDTRSGKGPVNGATLESQAVPATAKFDPLTSNFLSTGTLLDNNGFPILYDFSAFGNTRNTTVSVPDVFTQPIHTILSGTVPTLDFTLKNTSPVAALNPSFATSILANSTISGVAPYYFTYGPVSLPTLVQRLGTPSRPAQINVLAFGLTSTGISISVSGANFEFSTDGSSFGASGSLSITGGTIWVRYNATVAGSNTGSLSINTNDNRPNAGSVVINNLSGTAIAPSVPFVRASVSQLSNAYAPLFNTAAASSVFTISGNLLLDNVTVNGTPNFQVSTDNASWTSQIIFTTAGVVNKLLVSQLVYARYNPTVALNAITANGVNVAGSDNGAIILSSPGAVPVHVNMNGTWGVKVAVGPVDVNGNIIQNGAAPAFPQFSTYTGKPSPAQITHIKATGVPAGQYVIVNTLSGLQLSTDNVTFTGTSPLLFTPDANGNLAATAIYVRYKGTGSLGTYGNTGGAVVAVGLQGATNFDVQIGTQGVTESLSSANSLFGYIVSVSGNTATITNITPVIGNTVAGFTNANLGVGSIITSSNAGASVFSFEGIVTSIDAANNIVYLDRNFTTTAANKPLYYSTKGKIGTATVSGVSAGIITLTSGFSPNPALGAPLYANAINSAGFSGVITAFDATGFTISFDNTGAPANGTPAVGSVVYYDNSQVMFNVQSSAWQANKDYNRAAIWFTDATLADSAHANATSSQVITVSGNNTPNLAIGRDLSTVYSLAVEVSLDNVSWKSLVVVTSTGIVPPTPVYVRYNPTSTTNSGIIAGSPTTLPGFGQHTGSILENNSTAVAYSGSKPIIYTIGFSDPILYASATPVTAATNPQIPGQIVNQLSDLYAIVGASSQPTLIYVYGNRLQDGQIAISSSNNQFWFSTDLVNWTSTLNLTGTNNISGVVYVKYAPTSIASSNAAIYLSTLKSQQQLNVNGFAIPVPQPIISSSIAELSISNRAAGSFTVNGENLTSVVTITAPAGFEVWANGSSYTTTALLMPNSLNYGTLAPTAVLVTFTGTTSVAGSLLSLATEGSMLNVTLSGSITTGIESELDSKYKISLYPNPTAGVATLTHEGLNDGLITVFDYTGRVAYSSSFTGAQSKTEISSLGSGFYLVVLSTKEGTKKLKLIVE